MQNYLYAWSVTAPIWGVEEHHMKAVVFRGVSDIRIEDVPEPQIEDATDAVVRLTASAICGTDLHFVRGTVGERSGTITSDTSSRHSKDMRHDRP